MADIGITVRYDEATYEALQAEAARRKLPVAEVVRQVVQRHLAAAAAPAMLPEIESTLETVLERVFGRHVNRLAAIGSKAVVQAAWAKWLVAYLIEQAPAHPQGTPRLVHDLDGLLEATHQAAVRDTTGKVQPWDAPSPAEGGK